MSTAVAAMVFSPNTINANPETGRKTYDPGAAELFARVAYAQEYYLDVPEPLLKVAFCESWNQQHFPDGRLVTGPDGHDKGRFQIRATVHEADAKRLGHDIYTWEGNSAYALHLYETQGLNPWYSSESCWRSYSVLKEKGYPF